MNYGAKQIVNNMYHKEDKIGQGTIFCVENDNGANCSCIQCIITMTNIIVHLSYTNIIRCARWSNQDITRCGNAVGH